MRLIIVGQVWTFIIRGKAGKFLKSIVLINRLLLMGFSKTYGVFFIFNLFRFPAYKFSDFLEMKFSDRWYRFLLLRSALNVIDLQLKVQDCRQGCRSVYKGI